MIQAAQWAIFILAVLGVLLNNARMRACFYVWLVSNALAGLVHAHADLWILAARDLVFWVLAIHGLWAWGRAEI